MGKVFLFVLAPLSGLMLFCLAAWLSRKVRGCSVWTLPRSVLVALAVLALVAVDFAQKSLPVPPSLMPPSLPMGAGTGVTNIWEWIGEVNVPSGATNLTFIAEAADLPGAPASMPAIGFFRLGSFADTDGDGLDDTVETGDFAFVAGFPQFYPLPDEDSRLGWRVFTAEDPPDMVRMPLPLPFAMSNDLFVAFSVDTCGLVHLYTNATDLAYAPYLPNRDLSRESVLDSALTIAPLWAPLAFGTQSVVRVCQSIGGILSIESQVTRCQLRLGVYLRSTTAQKDVQESGLTVRGGRFQWSSTLSRRTGYFMSTARITSTRSSRTGMKGRLNRS